MKSITLRLNKSIKRFYSVALSAKQQLLGIDLSDRNNHELQKTYCII